MPYRGPNAARYFNQVRTMSKAVGQTALWRQFISASAANSVAGFGQAQFWREQIITAFFGSGVVYANTEMERPVGEIAAGVITCFTEQPMNVSDQVIWRGVTYRVDSQPTYSVLDNRFINVLTRGK